MTRIRWSTSESRKLNRLATQLLRRGVSNEQAVAELQRAGSLKELRRAAGAIRADASFPISLVREWLLVAAGDKQSVAPLSSEEERQLSFARLPAEEAFAKLVEVVPTLANYADRAFTGGKTGMDQEGLFRLILEAQGLLRSNAASDEVLTSSAIAPGLVGQYLKSLYESGRAA